MQLTNNTEWYVNADHSKLLVAQRGNGKTWNFTCDSRGKEFIQILINEGGNISDGLKNSYSDFIEHFIQLGLIQENISQKRSPLNHILQNSPSQFQFFEESGLSSGQSQEKIQNAKIGIIGCGGIGSWIILQLASLGIKNFVLIDPDTVSNDNLNRQFFKKSDIGQYKTNALQKEINSRFENINWKTYNQYILEQQQLDHMIPDCDYVLIAADFPSRDEIGKLIGNWCLENNKIHIICGGYSGHTNALGLTVIPGKTPCWNCFIQEKQKHYPQLMKEGKLILKGPKISSGIAPLVSLSASMTSWEVARIIVGLEPMFTGNQYDYSLNKFEMKRFEFQSNPECLYCEKITTEGAIE